MTPTKLPVVQRLIVFAVAIAGLLSATHRRRPIGRIDRAWDWRGSSRCYGSSGGADFRIADPSPRPIARARYNPFSKCAKGWNRSAMSGISPASQAILKALEHRNCRRGR